tara:strand:+ start:502 stop:2427 length:1926 start_codon:yes stop_codon:yes gene_type:complete
MKWTASFLLSLIIAFAFYWGLDSKFQFDDYANIVKNDQLHITDTTADSLKSVIFSGHSGTLMRPISMISFSFNYVSTGLDPFYFKVTNLAIHIVNTILVFFLSCLLVSRLFPHWLNHDKRITQFAFFAALVWGLSPINLTSVLYVVQRMTSLSAFFVFVGMLSYIHARQFYDKESYLKSYLLLIGVVFAGLLSVLSKENGLLLFVYIFLIEIVIFKGKSFYPVVNKPFLVFFSLTLLLPAVLVLVYTLINPSWIFQGYVSTNYGPAGRVLTEARVLWSYISWIILPNNYSLGLFHDDILISKGWLEPLSTIFAVIAHVTVIAGMIFLWLRNKLPGLVFGVALFYSSHLIESTVIALEIAHEHRNYVGAFGIAFSLVYLLCLVDQKKRIIFTVAMSLYCLFLLLITVQRASGWGQGLESALIEAEHHPESAAAHYEVGRQYTALPDLSEGNFSEKAKQSFKLASSLDKGRADALFALFMMSLREQSSVDPLLLEELHARLQNGPVYASHASWLKTFVACYKEQTCAINQEQMMGLLQSALNNPSVVNAGLTASVIFSATADFLAHSGNYENALEMAKHAVQHTKRNQIFIIDLINLSLHFRDLETAKKWLPIFEEKDYFGAYKSDIRRMRDRLNELSSGGDI